MYHCSSIAGPSGLEKKQQRQQRGFSSFQRLTGSLTQWREEETHTDTYSYLWTRCRLAESTLFCLQKRPETWWGGKITNLKKMNEWIQREKDRRKMGGWRGGQCVSDLPSCCSPRIMGLTIPLSMSSFPELCTKQKTQQWEADSTKIKFHLRQMRTYRRRWWWVLQSRTSCIYIRCRQINWC